MNNFVINDDTWQTMIESARQYLTKDWQVQILNELNRVCLSAQEDLDDEQFGPDKDSLMAFFLFLKSLAGCEIPYEIQLSNRGSVLCWWKHEKGGIGREDHAEFYGTNLARFSFDVYQQKKQWRELETEYSFRGSIEMLIDFLWKMGFLGEEE